MKSIAIINIKESDMFVNSASMKLIEQRIHNNT